MKLLFIRSRLARATLHLLKVLLFSGDITVHVWSVILIPSIHPSIFFCLSCLNYTPHTIALYTYKKCEPLPGSLLRHLIYSDGNWLTALLLSSAECPRHTAAGLMIRPQSQSSIYHLRCSETKYNNDQPQAQRCCLLWPIND